MDLESLTADELRAFVAQATTLAEQKTTAASWEGFPAATAPAMPDWIGDDFVAWLGGYEPSNDYASAAAAVEIDIADLLADNSEINRSALIASLGMLFRRVMAATPHARQMARERMAN